MGGSAFGPSPSSSEYSTPSSSSYSSSSSSSSSSSFCGSNNENKDKGSDPLFPSKFFGSVLLMFASVGYLMYVTEPWCQATVLMVQVY